MIKFQLSHFDHRVHLDALYALMMDPDEQALFMAAEACNSLKEFDLWIHDRLKTFYHEFEVIENAADHRLIGFVYAYDWRRNDGHCKVGVFIVKACRDRGVGALAALEFMDELFRRYPLRKLYSEVYAYNRESLQSNLDAGFTQEGVLKEYRFWDGAYHDLHILSIDRQRFQARWNELLRAERDGHV